MKVKWYQPFYKDIEIDGPIKINIKGIVLLVLLPILIIGGILLLSGWTCLGCVKEPMKIKLEKSI